MSKNFYKIKIKEIRKETKNAKTFILNIPVNKKAYFKYKPGQHIVVKIQIDGKEYRRSYSIINCPFSEDEFAITVKRIKNGIVSNFLNNEIKKGDELEIMPPEGNFCSELNPARAKEYFLIAGGSGITPVFSILKSILSVEKESKIVLIYSNKNKEETIFFNKLEELRNKYNNRLKIYHFFSELKKKKIFFTNNKLKFLNAGRVNENHLKNIFYNEFKSTNNIEVFLCGPKSLMDDIEKILNKLKESSKKEINIHLEHFIINKDLIKKNDKEKKSTNKVNIKVILDGEESIIKAKQGESILDALLNKGLDPPYSCQSGVCGTCIAKIEKGKVKMNEDVPGISKNEMEKGFVLTCSSYPVSDEIVVNYDE